jgi:hypothetical protein
MSVRRRTANVSLITALVYQETGTRPDLGHVQVVRYTSVRPAAPNGRVDWQYALPGRLTLVSPGWRFTSELNRC